MKVTVICAWPRVARRVQLNLPAGATVRAAIAAAAGELDVLRGVAPSEIVAGVFGRVVPLVHVLNDGDRVEIYRPLIADAKTQRRQRAKQRV